MTQANPLPSNAVKYLTHMAQALSVLPHDERAAILEETRAHFLDALEAGGETGIQKSIDAFGPPEIYAANFVEPAQIRIAVASRSARTMFRRAMDLAGRGIGYFIAAKIIVFVYISSFAFAIIALLKTVMPDSVGFWPSSSSDGFPLIGLIPGNSLPDGPDLLGYWLIPIAIIISLATFVLGNWIVRKTLQRFLRKT